MGSAADGPRVVFLSEWIRCPVQVIVSLSRGTVQHISEWFLRSAAMGAIGLTQMCVVDARIVGNRSHWGRSSVNRV